MGWSKLNTFVNTLVPKIGGGESFEPTPLKQLGKQKHSGAQKTASTTFHLKIMYERFSLMVKMKPLFVSTPRHLLFLLYHLRPHNYSFVLQLRLIYIGDDCSALVVGKNASCCSCRHFLWWRVNDPICCRETDGAIVGTPLATAGCVFAVANALNNRRCKWAITVKCLDDFCSKWHHDEWSCVSHRYLRNI